MTRANSEPAASASNGKPPKPKHNGASADSTISPIAQAVAVRTALREALAQTNELIRALKRDKRQGRLVASTLASLKQLQKVAG